MASVLIDIHLTEAVVNGSVTIPEDWSKGLDDASFRDLAYRSVLRKHGLTEEAFDQSVAWYSKHLIQYEKVYLDVQKRLDAFRSAIDRGQFENIRDHTHPGLDSVKTLALYRFGTFRRDTTLLEHLYRPTDSIPSKSVWTARQWMYALPKAAAQMDLYPKLSIHSVFNTSDPDSLKMYADSLLRHSEPTVEPVVRKEVLAPGARRLPTRNFREVPKNEQIRRKYQQRARELERTKLTEQELERQRKIEASKQSETNHWK
jgi:hypothetical protein